MNLAVVDIETTGFSVDRDEIVEVAIVTVYNGVIGEQWVSLVRPAKSVGLRSTKIHGIDNDMLMTAPRREMVVQEVARRLVGTVLVEHNLDGFDSRFLSRFLGEEPWSGRLNTLSEARRRFPGLGKYDLPTLCTHLGVSLERHHHAGTDALATAGVLIRLLEHRPGG
jgi:DNA polymerase III epsilon subunit family exonuclease